MKKLFSVLLLCLAVVGQVFGEINIPSNEIWYTTTDGQVIIPDEVLRGDEYPYIVSNTYENGQGKIVFDRPVRGLYSDYFSSGKERLYSVIVPGEVEWIQPGVFQFFSSLSSIIVADGNLFLDSRNNCNAIIETQSNTLLAGCVNTIIPEDVTSIGMFALACTNIESITLPSGVTSLEEGAFGNCPYLREINIPDNVTSIGDLAFAYCYSLTDINIPSNVTYIGSRAFERCTGLTSITIPSKVTSIGDYAFFECSGLSDFYVGWNNPTDISISTCAFSRNGLSNTILHVPTGTKSLYESAAVWMDFGTIVENGPDNNIIYYTSSDGNIVTPSATNRFGAIIVSNTCNNRLGKIVFDKNVTSIGDNAFYGCNNLSSITIPNSVISIGESAFSYCTNLVEITIPNSVLSIENNPFTFCNSLSSISVDSRNPVFDSRLYSNAIIETNSNKLLAGCKNTIIPYNVTCIGDRAFQGHKEANIYIPDNVTSIGDYAFTLSGLKSITISKMVTSIGKAAFISDQHSNIIIEVSEENPIYDSRNDCNAIIETATNKMIYANSKTRIPDGVVELNSCFAFVEDLTEIIIPSSVTNITGFSFYDCNNISKLICNSENPPILWDWSFYAINQEWNWKESTLVVPYGTKEKYEDSTWNECFGSIVEYEPTFLDVADGTIYTRTERATTDITYTRTFNNMNWQALYVPFSLSYDDFSEYMDIAWLNDTHMYDDDGDGLPDRTSIEFFVMKDGTTDPNTPYLVRAKHKGEVSITIKDAEIYPAVTNPFECSTFKQVFTVKGTYTGVSGAEMMRNHYYAPVDGKIKYALNENASLKPQRWYMYMTNKDGSPVSSYAPSIRMMVDGEDVDAEETSITTICDNSSESLFYSIDGKTIVGNPSRSGMYVTNNKKVIVK